MHSIPTTEMAEFNRLYKETDNIYTRYAASHGISATTMCILYSLYIDAETCTQSRLVEDWGIPSQTVNSCLKALEKNGIVKLEFARGNRKSKCIFLTEQGQTMAMKIIDPLVTAENAAMNALEFQERNQFIFLNRKYSEALRENLLGRE